MKTKLTILSILLQSWTFAQQIEHVWFTSEGGILNVYYTLLHDNLDQCFDVNVFTSFDNYQKPLQYVQGDVNKSSIKPGKRKLVWDAKKEIGNFDGNIAFKIVANPQNCKVLTMPTSTPVEPFVSQEYSSLSIKNEKRVALVIGNSAYPGGRQLKNPANDAKLIAEVLTKLDFEVISLIDANKKSMERAVRKYSERLAECNVALFYYAGHGIQIEGLNYLIPIDAELNKKEDCKWEAVSVNFVVEEFEKYPNNTNIVILDACRTDPFRSWTRGGDRGFKAITPSSGTIISFATTEGATASDGSGENGLYTQELVKQLVIPQPIESVFKKTRVEVEKLSSGNQSPQEWSKLKGDFYFKRE